MKKMMVVLISVLLGIAWTGSLQAMEFDELGGVEIHGFISQGYLKSSDNNFFAQTEKGTTQFNEAGINFSTDVTERLRIGLQFLARDLGTIGNNEVLLDWAVADYRWRDWLGLRVGNLKFQHGLYNETRDIDMLRTSIFLPQSVYNEAWRESSSSIQGAGLYGDLSMGVVGSINYGGQYGTIYIDPDKGAARLIEDQWPQYLTGGPVDALVNYRIDVMSVDQEQTYTGLLHWNTPLDGLLIGGSVYGFKFDADCKTILRNPVAIDPNLPPIVLETTPIKFNADVNTITGSLEYTWRNLVLAGEYAQTRYNISFNDIPLPAGPPYNGATTSVSKVFDSVGYYGSMTYRFTYWFEMGAYYSEYYPNDDDRDGEKRVAVSGLDKDENRGYLKDTCATLRFDINENWVMKLEGHVMRGTATLLGADNPDPDPTDNDVERYKKDWVMGAAKLTYSF